MSSDAEQIRVAARAVSGLSGEARAAGLAVTGAGHARWESQGARTFRDRLDERRREFGSGAKALEQLSHLLMSHAHHVEVHEAALLKAILAVEKAGATLVDDASDLAGQVQKGAQTAGASVLDGAKTTLSNMNPLTGLRSMGRSR